MKEIKELQKKEEEKLQLHQNTVLLLLNRVEAIKARLAELEKGNKENEGEIVLSAAMEDKDAKPEEKSPVKEAKEQAPAKAEEAPKEAPKGSPKPAEAADEFVLEGQLEKKGQSRRNWNVRWFILTQGQLSYYKKKEVSGTTGLTISGSQVDERDREPPRSSHSLSRRKERGGDASCVRGQKWRARFHHEGQIVRPKGGVDPRPPQMYRQGIQMNAPFVQPPFQNSSSSLWSHYCAFPS